MRAAFLLALLGACASCPRPVMGLGEPDVENQELGLPKPVSGHVRALLDDARPRHCQMVFEPAFSFDRAVWFVHDDPRSDARLIARVRTDAGIQSFEAPLDGSTALRLSRLCLAALTAEIDSCASRGMDGTHYHFANPSPDRGYVMATFWTPRRGTLARAVVELADALRDYAAIPETMRYPLWIRIQEAESELTKLLEP
jgi:hypothetical protein